MDNFLIFLIGARTNRCMCARFVCFYFSLHHRKKLACSASIAILYRLR